MFKKRATFSYPPAFVSNKEEDSAIIQLLANLLIEQKKIIIKIIKAFEDAEKVEKVVNE